MFEITTDRLQFRQWCLDDYDQLAAFYSDEKNARFVGGVKKGERAWRLMATYIGHYHLRGYSYPAIETKDTRQLIGTIGLWNSEPWPEPELGYWLLPHAQGKGYGLEAGRAVFQFAKSIALPSLVSYIDPANEPSKRLAKKIGAKYDATIKLLQFGTHEVYRYW